jgi:hypothetical protein
VYLRAPYTFNDISIKKKKKGVVMDEKPRKGILNCRINERLNVTVKRFKKYRGGHVNNGGKTIEYASLLRQGTKT